MKVIRIENKIISLENVSMIELSQHGSGAKSNPYYSGIHVHYQGNCPASYVHFDDDKEQKTGNFYMDRIVEILGGD